MRTEIRLVAVVCNCQFADHPGSIAKYLYFYYLSISVRVIALRSSVTRMVHSHASKPIDNGQSDRSVRARHLQVALVSWRLNGDNSVEHDRPSTTNQCVVGLFVANACCCCCCLVQTQTGHRLDDMPVNENRRENPSSGSGRHLRETRHDGAKHDGGSVMCN